MINKIDSEIVFNTSLKMCSSVQFLHGLTTEYDSSNR